MSEEKLKTSEAQRRASIKWQKENYSRIPLDVPKAYHEELKKIAKAHNMTLGAYIKEAIAEKVKREEQSNAAKLDDLQTLIDAKAREREQYKQAQSGKLDF